MSQLDKAFTGSIPALYDRYLGTLLFESFAADLAQRLAAFGPKRVLETAAGTGIATRALLGALPPTVEVVATDLNQAMLDHAAKGLAAPNLAWRQADALALPFDDGGFDAVACQFGAMFFPDKPAGYREARRVLKPGGRFMFNIWDRLEANEVSQIVSDAVAALYPDDPPRFLARTPFGHHDVARIGADLRTAGFSDFRIDTVERRGRSPSPEDAAIGLCQGTPLRAEIEARGPDQLAAATAAAARALTQRFGPGPIDRPIQAHVIVATR